MFYIKFYSQESTLGKLQESAVLAKARFLAKLIFSRGFLFHLSAHEADGRSVLEHTLEWRYRVVPYYLVNIPFLLLGGLSSLGEQNCFRRAARR